MKFQFLKASDIAPRGWLKKQLDIQAEGLHGNLDIVWNDVAQSKWLGGEFDGWERFPYFLDGYIPLAYLTKDQEKIRKARHYIDVILDSQLDNGFIKPENMPLEEAERIDRWSMFLILKVLATYAECEEDARIVPALEKGLDYLYNSINAHSVRDWAASRWFECCIPILWLYQRKPSRKLILLARRLKAQGIDYRSATDLWSEPRKEWSYETHVVNIAMALKYGAVYHALMGTPYEGEAEAMLKVLTEKHSTAYGHFTGDECLAGSSPIQGSELCGIVEAMYSYEWLTAVTGEAKWADALERLAFNGLPATVTEDMWAHQYDQQVNQAACKAFDPYIFGTNGPESNMFGLEPHFGCCTANFGQGFPKFAASCVMREGNGLVFVSPVPVEASLDVNGERVTVACRGEYPFRNQITLVSDGEIAVKMRVPFGMAYHCDAIHTDCNGWFAMVLQKDMPVHITFYPVARFTDRPNGAKAVEYGALIFSLPIAHDTQVFEYERDGKSRKQPYCDYAFTPAEAWNYGFDGDTLQVKECDFDNAFSRSKPPLKITAKLAPVKWGFEPGYDGIAAADPGCERLGQAEEKELVPYGCTYLRITEMKSVQD